MFFGFAITNIIDRLRRQLENRDSFADQMPFDWEWDERRVQYKRWEKLYANSVYNPQGEGGEREAIVKWILNKDGRDIPLVGFYAPIAGIVETYQNVFRGAWGRDIKPLAVDGKTDLPTDDPLYQALTAVWQSSNLDTQKQPLQTWAALYGTVGLRVVAKNDGGKKSVKIHIDHPGRIIDFDEDDQGNVTEALLRYVELEGPLGENRKSVKVEERLSKTEFVMLRNGVETQRIPNELGFCPYVIMRHKDVGSEWGVPAHFGSEDIIHRLNWRITRQDTSVDRHQFPKWFASGSGNAPTTLDLGETSVVYSQTQSGDPQPTLVPIVPQINQLDTMKFWTSLKDLLKERQPELILTDLQTLAGQSGETIAQLLKPVEQLVDLAKANYEHALNRALQMGVSWRIAFGLSNLGTGTGPAGADRAFQEGKEAFTFNVRSPLPQSVFDQINQVNAATAPRTKGIADAKSADGMVSGDEQLRIIGYNEQQIKTIKEEQAAQDVIPTDGGGNSPIPGKDQSVTNHGRAAKIGA